MCSAGRDLPFFVAVGGSSASPLYAMAAQDGRAPMSSSSKTCVNPPTSLIPPLFHSTRILPYSLLSKLQPLSSEHHPPPPPPPPLSGSASSNSRTPHPPHRLPPVRNSRPPRPLVLGLLKKTTAGGKMSISSPKKQQMSDRAPSDCHA